MKRILASSNTCPLCKKDMGQSAAHSALSQSCPHCRTLVTFLSNSPKQQQRALPQTETVVAGPLLTGLERADVTLGFMEEFAGLVLLGYAFAIFFSMILGRFTDSALPAWTTIIGCFATGFMMFRRAEALRQRYPKYAQGWQRGRSTWGVLVEQVITFLFGVAALTILFPLGGAIVAIAQSFGSFGIVLGVGAAYLSGLLVRRVGRSTKGNKKP